jgi:hypothetical protein
MALQMHTTIKHKKNYKKEKKKSRYSDLFLVAAVQPPPRQHKKFSFSKRNASKKETVHKHCRRPIIYRRIFTVEKVPAHKTMPSVSPL